jgi:hypothetical protein
MAVRRGSQPLRGSPPGSGYRWCAQQEQYVAIGVCKKRADSKTRCRRCLKHWQQWSSQLPLPFGKASVA